MKVTEPFRDAEALADFANLDPTDSASVAYFKNNYPDFAPSEWWDYQTERLDFVPVSPDDPDFKGTDIKVSLRTDINGSLAKSLISVWQDTQEEIQRAWEDQFQFESVFNLTELLKMVFVAPTELVVSGSHLDLPDGAFHELSTSKAYSFHEAVLYLHQNSWRAKICKGCEKHFVANHPKRDFCEYPDARGETCRHKNDNKRRLDYYYETGKGRRQTRARKSSPRLPGSRRKRAAAKT